MGKKDVDLDRRLEAILGQIREVARDHDEATSAKGADGGRKAAKADGLADLAGKATAVDDEQLDRNIKAGNKAKLEDRLERIERFMRDSRSPSMAKAIGLGAPVRQGGGRLKPNATVKPFKGMKAIFSDYVAGEFITALGAYKGQLTDGIDPEVSAWGKAKLAEFTPGFLAPSPFAIARYDVGIEGALKATLGTTGATGGYVLPNNLVDSVVKPNVQKAIYQTLVTVINGVNVRGVDQPYRLSKPSRALFSNWGDTKENVNETYGSYTATLGTLAKIYDVGKQYLRFSAGAAENDVMDELTKSFALAENFAVIAGPGTGAATPGVNDPTYGVYTALAAAAAFNGYTTGFNPVATTLAGSAASAFTQAGAALAARNRESQAWVTDATTFWTIIGQGTDTAGFWVSPTGGPTGFARTASGGITFWGVPMYFDSNLGTNATTKIAIGGEWDALKLYRGMEFRIDSSDVAGTRWDQNLVGFRGEEEIGIHAGTAVNIGAFQLITGVIA